MKISIIHPSRGRAKQALQTALKWKSRSDSPFDYFLSFDSDEQDIYCKEFEGYHDTIVGLNGPNKSAIEAINNAAKIATGDLLIVISDDTDCPEHWDTLLLDALDGKQDFCAKCDDGLQPTLITMPVMDRVYYERYGYVYHPDYKHMHADEELTCVALMTGKYIKLPLLFPHDHYSTGRTKKDAVNDKNNETWTHGQRTLDRHALNNFGITNPVMKREDIKWR